MTKTNKILLLVLGVIVLFFISNFLQNKTKQKINQSNPSPKKTVSSQKDKFASQENEGGNVTVIVKPIILKAREKPTFIVEFNTHSVDLNFEIPQISSLTDDKGKVLTMPKWDGSAPGGHHRNGTLAFNETLSQTKHVELIITNIAGVTERKFRWKL